VLSRPARPIITLHLDDLVLLVAECLSGFMHFVIPGKTLPSSQARHARHMRWRPAAATRSSPLLRPVRYCSPRHGTSLNSLNEGSSVCLPRRKAFYLGFVVHRLRVTGYGLRVLGFRV